MEYAPIWSPPGTICRLPLAGRLKKLACTFWVKKSSVGSLGVPLSLQALGLPKKSTVIVQAGGGVEQGWTVGPVPASIQAGSAVKFICSTVGVPSAFNCTALNVC